jgi:hypothetical protein
MIFCSLSGQISVEQLRSLGVNRMHRLHSKKLHYPYFYNILIRVTKIGKDQYGRNVQL